ncbi:MAG: DUF1207 domain-containing protein [Candidatus Rokuibacteriota bacterium]|nr:MAG: DUF1207 domain-containing protein [Candidatus Rokubacteria bacterium]
MTIRIARLVLVLTLLTVLRAAAAPPDDSFIAGYAAAVLERVPGVTRVVVLEPGAPTPMAPPPALEPPRILSEWQAGLFPGGVLFKPLIADPRWPHFAAAWQHYIDARQFSDVAAVSFGESFAFYRDRIGGAWWEVGLHAGVFSVFDLDSQSFDLVNADYLVGIPLALRYEDFSALFRVYHQSSHLGDEFLLRTRTNRINLSYEAIDLKLSYEIADVVRLYAGGGYLDVKQHEENDWNADVSARAGIEIDGVLLTRKLQIPLEYFMGHSPNGQFYRDKVQYFGLGTHFHF